MIIHFDVDRNLNKLLKEDKREVSLTPETCSKIKNKNKISIITIKSQSKINKKVLDFFPKLKLIITRTVGIDHIDLEACKKRKIAVYNIPAYGSVEVAQHTIALLLAGAKNIVSANYQVHQGEFSYKNFLGISLQKKILGVIGTGRIGLEVIKIAKVMGMKIIAFDILKNYQAAKNLGFTYVNLKDLLKEADVITLHIPKTKENKYIVDNKAIKLMKKNVILINTARGELINTKALIKNINKFYAVCLDVLEEENNFSKNHPLLKFPNVVITPHCAFYTDESLKVIAKETEENIRRFQKGDKTNRVI